MAIAVFTVRGLFGDWYPAAQLAALAAVGAATYALTLWFAWPALVRDAWSMLRRQPANVADSGSPAVPELRSPST